VAGRRHAHAHADRPPCPARPPARARSGPTAPWHEHNRGADNPVLSPPPRRREGNGVLPALWHPSTLGSAATAAASPGGEGARGSTGPRWHRGEQGTQTGDNLFHIVTRAAKPLAVRGRGTEGGRGFCAACSGNPRPAWLLVTAPRPQHQPQERWSPRSLSPPQDPASPPMTLARRGSRCTRALGRSSFRGLTTPPLSEHGVALAQRWFLAFLVVGPGSDSLHQRSLSPPELSHLQILEGNFPEGKQRGSGHRLQRCPTVTVPGL